MPLQAPTKPAASSSPAPKLKRSSSTDDDLVDSDLNPVGKTTPVKRERKIKLQSPGTSPAPAPPDVEFMREGYTADDAWMMVEDEFQSVAQAFTKHLHHAEYAKLKRSSKARGQDTLQAIKRPTDGRTAQSVGTKLKLEADAKDKRIQGGLKGMGVEEEGEDEDNDEYMHDPHLAGLMTGSQRATQDLTGLVKPRANTRAAAGFKNSPQKAREKPWYAKGATSDSAASRSKQAVHESEESDDDDDLDGPSQPRAMPMPQLREVRQVKHVSDRAHKVDSVPDTSGIFKRFTKVAQEDKHAGETTAALSNRASASSDARPAPTVKPAAKIKDEDEPDLFLSATQKPPVSSFLAKRRAREAETLKSQAPSETKTTSVKSTIAVPTFMF
ncbi:hypothetical protein LTR56_009474 [Elasticomyces elasticus]|nr:hypothetical protein LTR22_021510 [Elasticomyces elasticus]KAK3644809.1 hypothetical protein LTR56_009474 [Elasticomyces elasticus]KAK4931007.1 hypothetical protein LTR49_002422 [Elasticomyces elasticus]KAK5740336.1 hypothetical protein LTS12_024984 [Elasticomyces elasticus]